MARPRKSVVNCQGHLTKAQIEERTQQEEKLKVLPADKIKPPTWLSSQGKKIFKDIVLNLEPIEILANVDNYNIALLADAMAYYIECKKQFELDKIGDTKRRADGFLVPYTNKAGKTNWVANPLIKIQQIYSDTVKKYSAVIGLNPASRLKIISNHIEGETDEFEKDFG